MNKPPHGICPEQKSANLYPAQIKYIQRLADRFFEGKWTVALRHIINQYRADHGDNVTR